MSDAATPTADDLGTPPTEIGAEFKISDLGTTEGGRAISALERAFEDSFGDVALQVVDEYGVERTYSFEGTSPIYCCHVPDEHYDPDVHGPQTMGFRYSYRFMRDIGTDNPIQVVAWGDTHFPEAEGVVYP